MSIMRKTILLMIFALTMVVETGCEKEPRYEIYENHEISACGVKDPLVNIEWLAKIYNQEKEKKNYSSFYIYMLKVADKEEYIFQITHRAQYNEHYSSLVYYNCSGDIVFEWETINPPSPSYNNFTKDKELIGTIFSMVKQ